MSEEMIVRFCSPTLAGIKTGNLFSDTFTAREEITRKLRALNRQFVPKGLRMIPLHVRQDRVLLYLYRPCRLKNDISQADASEMLSRFAYPVESEERCVIRLAERIRENQEFPHEIGLFLGYPPEDVRGFIVNRAANAKCVGFWKVYGDENKARRLFEKYRKCTAIYYRQWKRGKSIERLAVAD